MNSLEPFHEGEVAVQERTGERADAVRRGAMIRNLLTPAARGFLSNQRAIAVAAADDLGRPWASLWLGSPGFITSPTDRSMRVARERLGSRDDPLEAFLCEGGEVGTLAIDFVQRGRLRVNGVLTAVRDDFIEVTVNESFPNCKKYIRQRDRSHEVPPASEPVRSVARGDRFGARQSAVLATVDTVFVGSRHPGRGMDVSHRGGEPGFVRVIDDRTLRFPDYPGNGMFQTLGNFEVNPRAGVLAIDFAESRLLSLTGRVTVTFGGEEGGHPSGGTGRYWELAVEEWVDFTMPSGRDVHSIETSPARSAAHPPAVS